MPDQIAADPISDFDGLAVPPLDDSFFSDDINASLLFLNENDDVLNFDFTFDDVVNLPNETSNCCDSALPDCIPVNISSDPDDSGSNTESPELTRFSDDVNFNVAGYFNVDGENENENENSSESAPKNSGSPEPAPRNSDVVRVCDDGDGSQLNVSSSDSRDSVSVRGDSVSVRGDSKIRKMEFSGTTSSQGSDNCERSVGCSVKLDEKLGRNVVDWKVKLEEPGKNGQVLKRKKEDHDVVSESTRTIKYRRSGNDGGDGGGGGVNTDESNVFSEMNDDDEKRKTRLMRNRESAQLSRQRKKHYVEELEDKVRSMHSTIQDLNAKISYIVAENASLRQQQMSGGGGVGVGGPPMQGMYPHPPMAPMGYPWMPCPPYMLKPQGSQVPLVPIPRLKPQQPAVKPVKKESSKKNVGKSKTKKVASVSFLGILFFMLLFGGLVPMVNVRYGGIRDAISGGSGYIGNRIYDQRHERILMVNGTNHEYGANCSDYKFDAWKDHVGGAESNMKHSSSDEFASSGNASDPLVASLYVPRNDKLVKIDGNLIIHSVLASEKAKASHDDGKAKSDKDTSLALALHLTPHASVQGAGQNDERKSHIYRSTIEQQRALASGTGGKDNLKSTPANGKLQQWFREGLAGPMLSSGMCTEVFQFDVSPSPGAIVPATPGSRNMSAAERKNSTHLNKGRNRRILHGIPVPLTGSANNISKENNRSNTEKEKFHSNSSVSPMIVSVLVDPREVGDADVDGTIGTKSISRIFVVVLLDSVKYVTYSCMLPFKGSSHLVTA